MEELPFGAEHFCELGIDLALGHVKEKIDKKKLNDDLHAFLALELKRHENGLFSEEYDIAGLLTYIEESLFQDFLMALFNQNKKQRSKSWSTIISKAQGYASLANADASGQVAHIVLTVLKLYHDFFKQKNSIQRINF